MKYKIQILWLIIFLMPNLLQAQSKTKLLTTEVLVIGGGTGGTAAGIQSARMGIKTIIIESTSMLGGMITAAGVSCIDGNHNLPSGMWQEFRQALYKHYNTNKLETGWVSNTCFEPHVADSIFKAWAANEKQLSVYYNYMPVKVYKNGNRVTGADCIDDNGNTISVKATVIIDGTELGDVMKLSGTAYDIGMDDPKLSGEKEAREKNNIIQDLTWTAILKDYGEGEDKTISKPDNYNAANYYCSNTDAPCNGKSWDGDKWKMLNYAKLPNNKYMLNWPKHGNDYYLNVIENNYEVRDTKYKLAKDQTLGFIYFIQTELGLKNIGLADDELNNGMALIPYHRESRRLQGVVRMNVNHIKNPGNFFLYRTGISVGDYPIDHHHDKYPGKVPDLEFPPIPSFNIPLGVLISKTTEGLIVCDKSISVSNIANGSTRLQPVVLLTGQAAGVLGALSVKEKKSIRNISVRSVQKDLLKVKCYLLPYVDIQPGDPYWEAVQKAGATGILKGTGVPEAWANKTYFYPDSTITETELAKGLNDFEKEFPNQNYNTNKKVSIEKAWTMITEMQHYLRIRLGIPHKYPSIIPSEWKEVYQLYFGKEHENGRKLITRKQLAVLINSLSQNPFDQAVNIKGNLR